MELIAGLNEMQKKAVLCTEGPLLLFAGAGSGKTRVLTHRIAYLIEQGVSPYNILALTFTNKAAREMRERVNKLAKNGEYVWVSTFHSTCVRILRQDIDKLGFDKRFTIYDADDSERMLKKCIKDLNMNDKQFPLRSVSGAIGSYKDNLLSPLDVKNNIATEFRQKQIAGIYELYQNRLKENNALDFDDIIFYTVQLFKKNKEVLEHYQERFKYILVDEYQDTSTSQYQLIRLLSSKYRNICAVGDDDQSIYGWRGANIGNILGFEKDFKEAKVIKLEQNYRSSQTILNTANAVISNNFNRKAKKLWTENNIGSCVDYFKANSEQEEGGFIVQKILEAVEGGKKYGDFAVLYRNNALSRSIEEQLILKGIPYKLFGGVRFYQRKEIKDILSYLKFVYNTKDNVALLRIINVPKRGIGDTTIEKISAYAAENEISFFDAINKKELISLLGARAKSIKEFSSLMSGIIEYAANHTIVEIFKEILDKTCYVKELEESHNESDEGRVENIEELLAKAADFEKVSHDKSLGAFLEDVALVADVDDLVEGDDYAALMTIHSSKGLEFPVVFIIGFEEGVFPGYRSATSGDIKDLEEERRLCYVGMTRAMEKLYISSSASRMQHGQVVYNSPSRFLREIPVNCLENVAQKTHGQKPKTERTGISRFAEINKNKNSIDISFGGKNYSAASQISAPPDKGISFIIGDKVRQMKYGVGIVKDIKPAGADYEVTVEFPGLSEKKFMAHLSKLTKVEPE